MRAYIGIFQTRGTYQTRGAYQKYLCRAAFALPALALLLVSLAQPSQARSPRGVSHFYECAPGLAFNALYSASKKRVILEFTGHDRFRLYKRKSFSGRLYRGQGFSFRVKGRWARLKQPGQRAVNCKRR